MSTISRIRTSRERPPVTYRPLLTPAEVAAMFGVDPKTVTRWANQGKLRSVRTLGTDRYPGHHRFFEDEARALLNGSRS